MARVISLFKPRKHAALPSFYCPISLLDTIGKFFEKFLLSRIVAEINFRSLLREEKYRFRPGAQHELATGLVS